MLDQILADIRKTFDVDFVPLQLDDGRLEVLNINNMQSHLDGLLARHAIHDPLKDLPLWAKVWPGSFVLGRFLRKLGYRNLDDAKKYQSLRDVMACSVWWPPVTASAIS